MTLQDIINIVRRQLDDVEGGSKRLYSDDELAFYATNAQDKIAETCLVLTDSTTASTTSGPLCTIPVYAGTASYPLHPKIIRLESVRYDGIETPLPRTSITLLDVSEPEWRTTVDEPSAYMLDGGTSTLTLNRIPAADSNLRLTVKRLPLANLHPMDTTAVPEIPAIYHEKMINWMLNLAYLKHDAETFNPTKADVYYMRFLQDIEQIRRSQIRREPKCIFMKGYA